MRAAKPIPTDRISSEDFYASTELDASTGCVEWTRSVNQQGYGRLRLNTDCYQAHRVALALAGVELPPGLVVDHLCRNRRCVNVAHLEVVSPQVNTLRGVGPINRSMRAFSTGTCGNGHNLAEVGVFTGSGLRACAQCRRDAAARYRARKAVA